MQNSGGNCNICTFIGLRIIIDLMNKKTTANTHEFYYT